MKNKKGLMGFISMFVAIIIIAIILLVFVMSSGAWKKFMEEPAAMNYFGEDGSEMSFFDYMDDSSESLNEVRFLVASGASVEDAVEEVGGEW
jgi:hypothetical protein